MDRKGKYDVFEEHHYVRLSMKKCVICNGDMIFFDKAIILNKYTVNYWRCYKCGFINTDTPYWLEESYSEAIANSDIGLVGRNYVMAQKTSSIIKICFPNTKRYLDYGGGYGLLVRLMRDKGFNFQWYDKYCINLFAKNFEQKSSHYDIVTAYEVFEHLVDPAKDVEDILLYCDNLLFSTSIIPEGINNISDWSYFAPNHGQHVSFYTKKSLKILAARYNRNYIGCGDLHLFSKQSCSSFLFRFGCRFPSLINKIICKESLSESDYNNIIEYINNCK